MNNNIIISRIRNGRSFIYNVHHFGELIAHSTPLLSLAIYWAYQNLDASSQVIYAWRT